VSFRTLKQLISKQGLFVDGDWVESKDQDPNGQVRLIQLADIGVGEFINKSKRYMTSAKAEELKCTYLQEGDILIARMPDPIGRACIFPGVGQPCVTVVDVCILRVEPKEIDRKWLMYMINSNGFNNTINEFVTGTTRKRIARKKLEQLGLNVPPLETQKQIAAILEKADQLRKDCQQMEQELNNLAQSVFIDMFGDPVINPKGWERRVLSEFYRDEKTGTKCGPFGSALKKEDFSDSGVPVWNMDNITLSGSFIDEPSLFVPKEKFKELQSYSVLPGDVIISRAGTVGKMGVVYSKHPESLISTNLIRVRFGEQLLPEYFVSLMLYCKTRLRRLKVGADGDFSHMNTRILDKLEFPYPPIEIQRQYVEYLGKTDRELTNLEGLSKELDEQFQSLSTKAFSGQLITNNKAA
jgi:type I restriction enzyme, S subunit